MSISVDPLLLKRRTDAFDLKIWRGCGAEFSTDGRNREELRARICGYERYGPQGYIEDRWEGVHQGPSKKQQEGVILDDWGCLYWAF